jgi:hypothetical protein
MFVHVETLHPATMKLRCGLLLIALMIGQASLGLVSAQTVPVEIRLESPRPTTLDLGRERLRAFVAAHAVPAGEDDRRELYFRLSGILIDASAVDADFLWALAQRWARSPGGLDFSALENFAGAGWSADFRRYWALAALDQGERCRMLRLSANGSDQERHLANELASAISCRIDPPSTPSAAPDSPPPTEHSGPIHQLRLWVSHGCLPQWARCRLGGGSEVVSSAVEAYRIGEGETALEMLRATPDRSVLIYANAQMIVEMVRRNDRRTLSARVEQLIGELDLADDEDRRWMAEWSFFVPVRLGAQQLVRRELGRCAERFPRVHKLDCCGRSAAGALRGKGFVGSGGQVCAAIRRANRRRVGSKPGVAGRGLSGVRRCR